MGVASHQYHTTKWRQLIIHTVCIHFEIHFVRTLLYKSFLNLNIPYRITRNINRQPDTICAWAHTESWLANTVLLSAEATPKLPIRIVTPRLATSRRTANMHRI